MCRKVAKPFNVPYLILCHLSHFQFNFYRHFFHVAKRYFIFSRKSKPISCSEIVIAIQTMQHSSHTARVTCVSFIFFLFLLNTRNRTWNHNTQYNTCMRAYALKWMPSYVYEWMHNLYANSVVYVFLQWKNI